MTKTNHRYELANISIFPSFPEMGSNAREGYSFDLKVRYTTQISVSTQNVNIVDYRVNIPAVSGTFIDSHYVTDKLEEDILKYSEIVKDYKEPIFKFNVTYKSPNIISSSLLQVATELEVIEETLDTIFNHFLKNYNY